jgi:VWFA-related protein
MRKKAFLAVFFLLVMSVGFYPQQNPAQKVLRHDAAAVVKLVPIRVLDQNGRPVTDLKVEDFVLYDNKELKKITEFEVHSLAEFGRAMDKTGTTVGTTALQEKNRKYFLLLDIQSSDANGLVNAKKTAQQFIDTKLQPGDEVAILYYTGMTGLNMTQYLTSDKKKIKKGIERVKGFPPGSGVFSPDASDAEKEPPRSKARIEAQSGRTEGPQGNSIETSELFSAGLIQIVSPPLEESGRKSQDFSKNMSELANALQYIPGSKNLLLFSSQAINKDIGREFAAANTPVFTINTKNWIERNLILLSVKKKYTYTEHPLKEFALASGGQYFADIKETAAIADDIQTLSGNYYVLGYYINEQWDGRYHQIKVDVKKPGHKVFVQEGYNNPKPFDRWTDIEKQLHLYDLAFADKPTAKDILDAPVEPLFSLDGKGSNCLLISKFLVDAKTGMPPEKSELFMFIFDKDNKVVQSLRGEIDLATHAQKTFYPYSTASLKPGEYELRFVARDMATGQTLVGKSLFNIPNPDPAGMKFYSPLLLVPGKEPQFVQMSLPKRESQRSSFINFYPLLPLHCSPLVRNLETDEKRLVVVIPAEFQAKTAPEVNLDFRLTAPSTGEEFPIETKILETRKYEKGRNVLVLEIGLPTLRPGDYNLEIAATDKKTQARSIMKTSFVKK